MGVEDKVLRAEFRIPSKKQKFRWHFVIVFTMMIAGCSGVKPGTISRIALLAPFEGRYREVGYNAYYAVKLALADYGKTDIELVAVEDGNNVQNASMRAKALTDDPLVKAVIALGYSATNVDTQKAFGDTPVIVVGDWDTQPETDNLFLLTNQQINTLITLPENKRNVIEAAQIRNAVKVGDGLALKQFPLLNPQIQQVTVISSGNLPNTDFIQRYVNSAEFTPQPGLLATLTYDATGLIIQAISSDKTNITETIANIDYQGINGAIHFTDGYWAEAPIHYFRYDADGKLFTVDRPVE